MTPLDHDRRCVQCGYNLRGQAPSGTCPECGAPVSISLQTSQLDAASHHWIKGLRDGLLWLMIGSVATVFVTLFTYSLFLVFYSIAVTSSAASAPPDTPAGIIVFRVLATMACNGALGYGVWMITQREDARGKAAFLCAFSRWTLLSAFLVNQLGTLFWIGDSEAANWAAAAMKVLFLALVATGFVPLMLYLRQLALRIPDATLARQTTVLMWCMGSGIAMLTIFLVVMILITAATVGGTAVPGGYAWCTACPALLLVIGFGVWWITVLNLYRGAFNRAFESAAGYRQRLSDNTMQFKMK